MRLERLGAFHPSRLSFMRILLRRMRREGWRIERPVFEIAPDGTGRAVYAARGPERSYSLVAFAHDLPDHLRSDRVIAEAWDATFALFDGVPSPDDLARLQANVPRQEVGRLQETELCLARANRSVRLFEHVVSALAAGRQPDAEAVAGVGYLMRTSAVYGSGKFGAADRQAVADRPEFAAPFQPEMLTVYLIRAFVLDLVEALARHREPEAAAPLSRDLRRTIGIGNSTGLGMAPFLVNHPVLLNNWIAARETALARVRALPRAAPETAQAFAEHLALAGENALRWRTEDPRQAARLDALRRDLAALAAWPEAALDGPHPWEALWRRAAAELSVEGQEQLVSLMLEPHPDLADPLAEAMAADEAPERAIDGAMPVARLRAILEDAYPWALALDWSDPQARARLWYVSEEKLEPRLAERAEADLAPYEQPLAPGREAAALHAALAGWPDDAPVADLLLRAPGHRAAVRRAQTVARRPYAEIRDNTVGADLVPVDMLRCKLAFFGAGRFDPRSDRWVRISMFAGAPLADELSAPPPAGWD
jgi:hypothetical protein